MSKYNSKAWNTMGNMMVVVHPQHVGGAGHSGQTGRTASSCWNRWNVNVSHVTFSVYLCVSELVEDDSGFKLDSLGVSGFKLWKMKAPSCSMCKKLKIKYLTAHVFYFLSVSEAWRIRHFCYCVWVLVQLSLWESIWVLDLRSEDILASPHFGTDLQRAVWGFRLGFKIQVGIRFRLGSGACVCAPCITHVVGT